MPGVPLGNYIVMILASLTFMIQFLFDSQQQYLGHLVLQDWSAREMFGYMWLHTGLFHIICNLVLLWVFGRHVCQRLGNANYIFTYVILGFASAVVHMGYDGRPAIGASGAIMGILGVHIVLCFGRLSPAGPWVILVWFLLNLTVGILRSSPAANLAHVGGFFAGSVLAAALILLNVVEFNTDPSTPDAPAPCHATARSARRDAEPHLLQ